MPLATEETTIGTATAARLLGLSEARIRQLANAGILPVVSTPLGRTYRLRDVEALGARRALAERERAVKRGA